MELLQGARDKRDQQSIVDSLEEMGAVVVPINESISEKATELVKAYSLSHSLYLTDALVAATALHYQQPLISANDKHYRFIPKLTLQIFRPLTAG
jgi:predicted nucleic acid-binding protein